MNLECTKKVLILDLSHQQIKEGLGVTATAVAFSVLHPFVEGVGGMFPWSLENLTFSSLFPIDKLHYAAACSAVCGGPHHKRCL